MSGNPSPYCHVPGTNEVEALRGITCNGEAECVSLLPQGAVDRGIVGRCYARSSLRRPEVLEGIEPANVTEIPGLETPTESSLSG